MGDSGENAGTSIKNALGGVVGKFAALGAGIELLKAGMEAAKGFASSVLEIAKILNMSEPNSIQFLLMMWVYPPGLIILLPELTGVKQRYKISLCKTKQCTRNSELREWPQTTCPK